MALKNVCTLAAAAFAGTATALYPGGPIPKFALHSLRSSLATQDIVPDLSAREASSNIKEYNLSVPIDHFHNESKYEPHSDGHFNLRYWADTTHYKEGGPVIVLSAGEFTGEARLPYLEHGIVPVLTKATGGVGVVLEHRYYGTSYPTQNSSIENLRFLTTEQALADTAYFSTHFKVDGLDKNLTAPDTPHILYGGSYAGGFVALARKLYPEAFWGAISSSGVTYAIDDFWQYFEAARYFSPGECSPTIQELTRIIDHYLLSGDKKKEEHIKGLFGLKELWNDEFASVLMGVMGSLQATNWDPEEDSIDYGTFCAVISNDAVLFRSTDYLKPDVEKVVAASECSDRKKYTARLLNYIGHVKAAVKREKANCDKDKQGLRECFSIRFAEPSIENDPRNLQRSWTWQTCNQWGYFMSGAATPKDKPSMVSRALTNEYSSYLCKSWFNITDRPDVESINKHGGLDFSYPRLAFFDGRQDPWRCGGVHAIGTKDRKSTLEEPFELIDWGVHHWDEFGVSQSEEGVAGLPPKQVVDAQRKEVEIVKHWLKEFEQRDYDGEDEDL